MWWCLKRSLLRNRPDCDYMSPSSSFGLASVNHRFGPRLRVRQSQQSHASSTQTVEGVLSGEFIGEHRCDTTGGKLASKPGGGYRDYTIQMLEHAICEWTFGTTFPRARPSLGRRLSRSVVFLAYRPIWPKFYLVRAGEAEHKRIFLDSKSRLLPKTPASFRESVDT